MATYIIGDIHGCYAGLQQLLSTIGYNTAKDDLWFTGDLVNRGTESSKVLDFMYLNQDRIQIVLGNHDLHLLALSVKSNSKYSYDLKDVYQHAKFKIWCDWLRQQPLIFTQHNICLVHAGIYPEWSINEAIGYANEVEYVLKSDQYVALLSNMYGNTPNLWDKNLAGWDRLRFIINACVRMRYVDAKKTLDFENNMPLEQKPKNLFPWFEYTKQEANNLIVFGHWASLKAQTTANGTLALDGGYVWGGRLIAWCIDNKKQFSVTNS